ncbi:hypothetical protein POKO110462_04655 [Pontibacter korlensis]|uniref:Alpha/beta hydrolase n=2 Tax=Pontibacter korlensis TaxID=400092 RepID=A0A0E3UX08_9BACT|nr:hypothetical protein PKOR_08630 [Pontibacter korlensis]
MLLFVHIASAQKIERFYNVAATDTADNYTLVVKPTSGAPKGWVLLFPGFGEKPEDVLKETDLVARAAQAGYLVAIPYVDGNTALHISEAKIQPILRLVDNTSKKYKLKGKPLAVGGFSMGGTTAVKLTEYMLAVPTAVQEARVSALFAVDPLLDFERFERSTLKAVQRANSAMPRRMLQMLQTMLRNDFGTTAVQTPEKFYTISPYAYADTANTAIKPLKQLPVLFYTEPDIDNQFNSNRRDLYDLNTADCTAMIADLQSMGNQQVQLVITTAKGLRADGTINPHSWSILNVDQTINWLHRFMK